MRHSADPFQFKAQSCPSGDQLQRLYVIKETAIPGFHSWPECHKTHVDSQLSEEGSENFQTLTHDTDLTIYMDQRLPDLGHYMLTDNICSPDCCVLDQRQARILILLSHHCRAVSTLANIKARFSYLCYIRIGCFLRIRKNMQAISIFFTSVEQISSIVMSVNVI